MIHFSTAHDSFSRTPWHCSSEISSDPYLAKKFSRGNFERIVFCPKLAPGHLPEDLWKLQQTNLLQIYFCSKFYRCFSLLLPTRKLSQKENHRMERLIFPLFTIHTCPRTVWNGNMRKIFTWETVLSSSSLSSLPFTFLSRNLRCSGRIWHCATIFLKICFLIAFDVLFVKFLVLRCESHIGFSMHVFLFSVLDSVQCFFLQRIITWLPYD